MLPPLVERKISEVRLQHPEAILTTADDIDSGRIHIISRPLSISEAAYYAEVVQRDPESADEFVIRQTTIEVYSTSKGKFVPLSQIPLGVYNTLCSSVVDASGTDSAEALKQYLHMYRGFTQQAYMAAIAFICNAFQAYTPRDIEKMSINELAKNIALAELIHGKEFGIMNPQDLKEVQEKESSQVMNSIRRQAKQNDKIMGIDFAQENSSLRSAM